MYCSKCGSQMSDDDIFCSKCGTSLKKEQTKKVVKAKETAVSTTEKSDKVNLLEYFGHAKKLETQIYTLQQVVSNIELEISSLAIPRKFQRIEFGGLMIGGGFAYAGAWLGGIIGAIVLLIMMQQNGKSFLWNLFMELEIIFVPIKALLIAILAATAGLAIGVIAGIIIYISEKRDQKRKMEYDRARVSKEKRQIAQLQDQEIAIRSRISQTSNTLSRLYSLNVVYPKYRNLVAIVTMHEYLQSGRCSELTGHEGAYNLYESESRQNRIISDLGRALSLLEQIRDSQAELYDAIQESNYVANRIYEQNESLLTSNSAIEKNTEIAAYTSKIAAENTKISAYIDLCRY